MRLNPERNMYRAPHATAAPRSSPQDVLGATLARDALQVCLNPEVAHLTLGVDEPTICDDGGLLFRLRASSHRRCTVHGSVVPSVS